MSGCPLKCVYCHNPEGQNRQLGELYTAEELAKKILRFKPYFGKNGGVTFSGGEPLLYADFLVEVCKILKKQNVHIAIDTSGCVFNQSVKELLNFVGLVICDIKFPDSQGYEKYADTKTFDTICKFLSYISEGDIALWLRSVIVPNINDNEQSIDKYAALAKQFRFNKYQLLGFHTMGFSKYDEAGLVNFLKDCNALDEVRLAYLQNYLDKKLCGN